MRMVGAPNLKTVCWSCIGRRAVRIHAANRETNEWNIQGQMLNVCSSFTAVKMLIIATACESV